MGVSGNRAADQRFAVRFSRLEIHGEPGEATAATDLSRRLIGPVAGEALDRNVAESGGSDGGYRLDEMVLVRFKPGELAEFRRRVGLVLEFLRQVGEKRLAHGSGPETTLCDHVVRVQVAALPQPVLPVPTMCDRAGEGLAGSPRALGPSRALSRREYEVALGLSRGLSGREVAMELGLSPATVVTVTKRIYRKLGIHRRAQISDRLRAASSGSSTSASSSSAWTP